MILPLVIWLRDWSVKRCSDKNKSETRQLMCSYLSWKVRKKSRRIFKTKFSSNSALQFSERKHWFVCRVRITITDRQSGGSDRTRKKRKTKWNYQRSNYGNEARPSGGRAWVATPPQVDVIRREVTVCCGSYSRTTLSVSTVEARALNQQILILLMNVSAETTTSAFRGWCHLQQESCTIAKMTARCAM